MVAATVVAVVAQPDWAAVAARVGLAALAAQEAMLAVAAEKEMALVAAMARSFSSRSRSSPAQRRVR